MGLAPDRNVPCSNKLQHTGDNRGHEQAQAEKQDEDVRHYGRYEEMPPLDCDPVKEDHRHGVLQHREGECAEEEHRDEENAAHHLAMREESPQFLDQGVGLTRHDKAEILPQGDQQALLGKDVRKRDQDDDQHRYEREQGVIGDSPREQNTLVCAEALDDGERECSRIQQHPSGPETYVPHRQTSFEKRPLPISSSANVESDARYRGLNRGLGSALRET